MTESMPPAGSQPPPASLPDGVVLRYLRTGGLAPGTDELDVHADGRVQTARGVRRQVRERALRADEVRELLGELVLGGYFELPAEVGRQHPDAYAYEILVRSGDTVRSVVLYDGHVPPSMRRAMERLRGLLR